MNQGSATSVDRIRGWTDVPLNAVGLKDAAAVAQQLEGRGIDRVISSDLQRSRQTAAVIGRNLGVKPSSTRGLRPWNLGALQGQPSKEAAPVIEHFARERPEQAVPEGESFNQFTRRLLATLTRLQANAKRTGDTIALVSHFRCLKMMEAGLGCGKERDHLDLDTLSRNDLSPAAVLMMEPEGDHWTCSIVSRGLKE